MGDHLPPGGNRDVQGGFLNPESCTARSQGRVGAYEVKGGGHDKSKKMLCVWKVFAII